MTLFSEPNDLNKLTESQFATEFQVKVHSHSQWKSPKDIWRPKWLKKIEAIVWGCN